MRAVMINTCQMIICLFAVSNGQIPKMSVIGGYVNKGGIAHIACSIGTTITGSVAIARDGTLAFDCPVPNFCTDQRLSTDYTATQNISSGTTTLIIQNADKNRDGVNWTCSYNSGSASVPETLTVVSPATNKKMIEGPDKITLELICTYPTNLLSFIIYLGGVIYLDATPNRTVYQACTPNYEVSVNYTLTFPTYPSQSYNGTFSVYINNGFYNETLLGNRIYTFIADQTTQSPSKSCELELGLGLGLSSGIPCSIACIVVVIIVCKGYTYAYNLGLLLGLDLGITFQVSWIIIVSLISSGNQCKLELGLGLGLGSGIPCVIAPCIAVIFVCKGIPSRVEIGKGILKGLLFASVIGIFIVFLISETLKAGPPEPTGETPEEEPNDKKNKTKNKGIGKPV